MQAQDNSGRAKIKEWL